MHNNTTRTPPRDPGVAHADLAILKHLALKGGTNGTVKLSCSTLADERAVSTQTASRRLQQLEEEGLVERTVQSDGQEVLINDQGLAALRHEYEQYRCIFDAPGSVELTGTVRTGMGEGRYFVSLSGYKQQFEERLGYEPFEGTLNVELNSESVRCRSAIEYMSPILIDGWEDEKQTYGPAICHPVTLQLGDNKQYESAHIVAPKRTHHDEDQLEVLAPDELRETLSLDEGDQVTIHVKEH